MIATVATASSPGASALVPITPCRLFDTRPGDINVGSRPTPLTAGETFTVPTWGTNGNCTIPSGATGLSLNVVAIGPTASSFLTVFPADVTRPTASSLNWVAGQAPTPNGVTARLAADGHLSFYNLAGTVDLAVDVVGYYEPVGPAVTPGPDPARIIWVATSGGDFTSISAALASITDNDATHPYVVKVAPGTFDENAGVDMKPYVDIEGSGPLTVIRSNSQTGAIRFSAAGELRNLSVAATNGGAGVQAYDVASGIVSLRSVDIVVSPPMATGVTLNSSHGVLHDVDIDVTGSIMARGIDVQDSATLEMFGGSVTATSGTNNSDCRAVYVNNSTAVVRSVDLSVASCTQANMGISANLSTLEISDVTARADGANTSSVRGVDVSASTMRARNLTAKAFSGGTAIALDAWAVSTVHVTGSFLDSSGTSMSLSGGSAANLSDSTVWGATSGMSGLCSNVVETNMSTHVCT